MKKIDVAALSERRGSRYPSPFDAPCQGRGRRALGDAAGLSQFGVNLLVLEPGAWSAQRHWHGVTESGEETLGPRDCAGFKAGDPDGRHLINRSDRPVRLLEVGTGSQPGTDPIDNPDIDMVVPLGADDYHHRDGRPH
ncbi:MAG: transcriptional regulator [Phenylobacterium sp.]|nr:transcriptional regulator [Phenylobacterium sp.]